MNTTVWIIQGIVATALTASGLIIMLLPKEKLTPKLSWVAEYSDGMRYFICLSKIAGGIGLILPMYLNIMSVLTPIAACCIAVFMLLAMRYHFIKKEYKDVPATIMFLALSIFIAYNRF
ncbi:MAG: DoxX family protein [Bacteroidota bacterium]|nr:DoxX family protein [Bacteroidota bacterium]